LCRGIVDGGAILHPTENPSHSSGASRRALENGCLGFFAASNTHIYISFAVNHGFFPPFGPVVSLCRGIVNGGAILHRTENPTHPSGASRQALENGCLGFFAASNTHIYISFAVNHAFFPPFGPVVSLCQSPHVPESLAMR